MACSKLFTVGLAALAGLAAAYPTDLAEGAQFGGNHQVDSGSQRMHHGQKAQPSEQCIAAMASTCPTCRAPPSPSSLASGQQPNDQCSTQCVDRSSADCRQCRQAEEAQCRQCQEVNADGLIAAGCTQVACNRLRNQVCPVCAQQEANCGQCSRNSTTAECVSCQETKTACKTCLEQNSSELEGQCGTMEKGHRSKGQRIQLSEQCIAARTTTCPACPVPPTPSAGASTQQSNDQCAAQCVDRKSAECRECHHAEKEQCSQCEEVNADSLIAAGCTHVACNRLRKQVCPVCTQQDANCDQCSRNSTTAECVSCQETKTACKTCLEQNSSELEGQCGGMKVKNNSERRPFDANRAEMLGQNSEAVSGISSPFGEDGSFDSVASGSYETPLNAGSSVESVDINTPSIAELDQITEELNDNESLLTYLQTADMLDEADLEADDTLGMADLVTDNIMDITDMELKDIGDVADFEQDGTLDVADLDVDSALEESELEVVSDLLEASLESVNSLVAAELEKIDNGMVSA